MTLTFVPAHVNGLNVALTKYHHKTYSYGPFTTFSQAVDAADKLARIHDLPRRDIFFARRQTHLVSL